jgi:GntR family transcriptional regulator
MPAPADTADRPADGPVVHEIAPSFSPLYQQIKGLLLNSLQAAEWKPGEVIPSEFELAARFKVSQGTVRKAIDELAQENHLVRRQGKGTFVATHAEERTQYRFLRLMPDDGGDGRLQRRLLECRRMRAPAEVARSLELKGGEAAVQIRRLLLAGRPGRGAGRDLVAGPAVQGAERRAPERLARPDVRPVRGRVRRAHGARRRKDPGRGGDGG